jgi:hypothetical protein
MLLPRVTREVAEALVFLKVPEGHLALRVDPLAHLPWGAVVHSILVAAIRSVASREEAAAEAAANIIG